MTTNKISKGRRRNKTKILPRKEIKQKYPPRKITIPNNN